MDRAGEQQGHLCGKAAPTQGIYGGRGGADQQADQCLLAGDGVWDEGQSGLGHAPQAAEGHLWHGPSLLWTLFLGPVPP